MEEDKMIVMWNKMKTPSAQSLGVQAGIRMQEIPDISNYHPEKSIPIDKCAVSDAE
jgi:hypothetical protein